MSARDSFLKNFDRVRADSGGTGMDSSSCLDDVEHFDLKKVPDHFTQPQLPEVHSKVEHPEVTVFEQPKVPRARVSVDLDEKHKRFIETFDHVPEYRNIHYDGQAAVQDKEMSSQLLKELPDAPPQEPQIGVAEAEGRVDIPVFSEDREAPVPQARRLSTKQHSAKYKMAHDAFEALYK